MERNWKQPPREEGDIRFLNPKALNDAGTSGVVLEGSFIAAIGNRFDGTDYKFELEDGSFTVINGCGSLAYQLRGVEEGTFCQISYNGKNVLTSGPRKGVEAHDFSVLIEDLGDVVEDATA